MLGNNFSRIHIFIIFSQKIGIWHFMQTVSIGDNLHEMSNTISGKNCMKCQIQFLEKIRKISGCLLNLPREWCIPCVFVRLGFSSGDWWLLIQITCINSQVHMHFVSNQIRTCVNIPIIILVIATLCKCGKSLLQNSCFFFFPTKN